MIDHIFFKDGSLFVLDQRLLPFREEYVRIDSLDEVERVISEMVIRGAPLIGIVCAYGFAIEAKRIWENKGYVEKTDIEKIEERLGKTRPTAANLYWALRRMKGTYERYREDKGLINHLLDEAISLHREDAENNKKLSFYGSELIDDGDVILTHCNAGALATGGYGTALGVIKAAKEKGKKIKVYATETRPYMQGARLTVYELLKAKIEVSLVPDNHVGLLCAKGKIKKIIVGADRVALNGDFANKIGTYMIALCAKRHKIPFYVAAPLSTFDVSTKNGSYIPIEERDGKEIKYIMETPITLENVRALYYAFDVTPHMLVTFFITERGIIEKPFIKYIKRLFS